jgi:heat shock protein HtpX
MWELIEANKRKTIALICCMLLLFGAVGFFMGGATASPGHNVEAGFVGLILALIIALFINLVTLFFGQDILLNSIGAKHVGLENPHKTLSNVVEEMVIASGLEAKPKIFILDQEAPNAFATGRDPVNSAVIVTSGLLNSLSRDELQGVIAHEIAHVNNRDILFMTLLISLLGVIELFSNVFLRSEGASTRTSSKEDSKSFNVFVIVAFVLALVAPILSRIIFFATSRTREYLADACAVQYTRYPEGLASALEKISSSHNKMQLSDSAETIAEAVAPMFIVNPFVDNAATTENLNSTHPPTSKRIAILRSMGGAKLYDYDQAYQKIIGKKQNIIPVNSMDQDESSNIQIPQVDNTSPADRIRETTDLMWKLNNYSTVNCDCGTKLKIPPIYAAQSIECPHCMKVHNV